MVSIHDAEVSFRSQQLITPLQLSSGTITSVTEARAAVTVQCNGRRAVGQGAIYLSNIWAWPGAPWPQDTQDATLRRLCEQLAQALPDSLRGENWHPLEVGFRIHELACQLPMAPDPPALARAMCCSPFDAAVHDGAGLALGKSSFDLYDEATPVPSADQYFPQQGACRSIAGLIQRPRTELPAWFIVSKNDDLHDALAPAIKKHGIYCFKLKLTGGDNEFDVRRTVEVFRAAVAMGSAVPRLTIDTNEANPSADSVLDYLVRLDAADRSAYEALEYVEQPTNRDIGKFAFDWREVAQRKPVMLDEGLTDLSVLEEAQQQGYSGLALKTCKGHSMLLAAAAWAWQRNMLLSLQDLTNPGISLIHGALVGSHLPTINGAELNSPQFTPAANAEFLPRLQSMFEPRGGVHVLPATVPPGLGSQL